MSTAPSSGHVAPEQSPATPHKDWLLVCPDPGAVISISVTNEGRSARARVVVFLDSGQTLWFDSDIDGSRRDLDLHSSEVPGRASLRLATRAGEVSEPSEIGGAQVVRRSGRVPVVLEVALAPLARVVRLDDASGAPDPVVAQGFRITGALAVGSVIRDVAGQVWSSRSGFASDGVGAGTRIQAVFQDDSSLYAASTPAEPAGGRLAALQVHNRISRLGVASARVTGPERSVPWSVRFDFDDEGAAAVTGVPRHVEGYQHVAFLRPGATPGRWVRVSYTPYDFVMAGKTGFGLLEHVVEVDGASRPEPAPELPDPWD